MSAHAQEWLVELIAKFEAGYPAHAGCVLSPSRLPPSLAPVPRWVYALLRGPLLSSHTPLSSHQLSVDARTWLHVLYSRLPAAELCLAVQPALIAYPDSGGSTHAVGSTHVGGGTHACELPLSWGALRASGCRLFVLDACTHIFVYCAAAGGAAAGGTAGDAVSEGAPGDAALEFPPSKSSALWRDLLRLKQQRLCTARIVCCRAGTPAAMTFESYLEHDDEDESAASKPKFSFTRFLGFVNNEVRSAVDRPS